MRLLRASLVISLAAAAGCTDQGGTQIAVLNHQIPEEGCVLMAVEGDSFQGSGIVDANGSINTGASRGYYATPLVKNYSDSADGTLEAERTVIVHGAHVDLVIGTHADGSPLLTDAQLDALTAQNALKFTVPFSGAVTPDGGVSVFGFDAIPRSVVSAVGSALDLETAERGLIQIVYTVFGETIAGTEVESDPFSFPVTVCVGCLVGNIGACSAIPDGEYTLGGVCNLYQDGATECCVNSMSEIVCPAVPEDIGA